MNAISNALSGTPWWVYLLLVILVRRGIAAARPSVMRVWKLAILPVIFLVLDVAGMAQNNRITMFMILLWILLCVAGGAVGYWLFRNTALRADRGKWLVGLPGDVRVLPLVLVVFAVKYVIQYLEASSGALASSAGFIVVSLAVSGFFTGIFMGRFCTYLLKFFAAPDESLVAAPNAS